MTDREIAQLFDSTQGEDTALKSLLPKGPFNYQVTLTDSYSIIDNDAPATQIPGYKRNHKYNFEGCMYNEQKKKGVCLSVWLLDSEANKQKLRTYKSSPNPTVFHVSLWSIIETEIDGEKFKVINFMEQKTG